jgi:hypothetical protein
MSVQLLHWTILAADATATSDVLRVIANNINQPQAS